MEQGPLLHVYCDESRQTQDRYMVFGGVIVHATAVEAFNQAMKLWRDGAAVSPAEPAGIPFPSSTLFLHNRQIIRLR